MMGAQSKQKSKIGLDIGSHSIKMVEIADNPERPALLSFGIKKIQDSSGEGIITHIKSVATECKISAKDISIAISGSPVVVRFITMPRMSNEDLAGAIRFEAEKSMPFNINDCVIGFQVLRKIEKENKLEIIVVAAKKAVVEDRVKLIDAAGLSVKVVDVDSFALANSFLRNFPDLDANKTRAILNIGATLSNLSIIRGGTICFVRDVAIGGNDFDAAIAKGSGIEIGSAQELKSEPKEKTAEVVSYVRPVIANLLDEVRLSFSYYENQYGASVDETYLSGGSAGITGLAELFEETFGTKPALWDPFRFLDRSSPGLDSGLLDKSKGSFAVAVGLALR